MKGNILGTGEVSCFDPLPIKGVGAGVEQVMDMICDCFAEHLFFASVPVNVYNVYLRSCQGIRLVFQLFPVHLSWIRHHFDYCFQQAVSSLLDLT